MKKTLLPLFIVATTFITCSEQGPEITKEVDGEWIIYSCGGECCSWNEKCNTYRLEPWSWSKKGEPIEYNSVAAIRGYHKLKGLHDKQEESARAATAKVISGGKKK